MKTTKMRGRAVARCSAADYRKELVMEEAETDKATVVVARSSNGSRELVASESEDPRAFSRAGGGPARPVRSSVREPRECLPPTKTG
jgi:hypothetical protein